MQNIKEEINVGLSIYPFSTKQFSINNKFCDYSLARFLYNVPIYTTKTHNFQESSLEIKS